MACPTVYLSNFGYGWIDACLSVDAVMRQRGNEGTAVDVYGSSSVGGTVEYETAWQHTP